MTSSGGDLTHESPILQHCSTPATVLPPATHPAADVPPPGSFTIDHDEDDDEDNDKPPSSGKKTTVVSSGGAGAQAVDGADEPTAKTSKA